MKEVSSSNFFSSSPYLRFLFIRIHTQARAHGNSVLTVSFGFSLSHSLSLHLCNVVIFVSFSFGCPLFGMMAAHSRLLA